MEVLQASKNTDNFKSNFFFRSIFYNNIRHKLYSAMRGEILGRDSWRLIKETAFLNRN